MESKNAVVPNDELEYSRFSKTVELWSHSYGKKKEKQKRMVLIGGGCGNLISPGSRVTHSMLHISDIYIQVTHHQSL